MPPLYTLQLSYRPRRYRVPNVLVAIVTAVLACWLAGLVACGVWSLA